MIELLNNIKEIGAKVYATHNAYDVIRFIDGRKEDVRILYDVRAKLYYFAFAGFTIHPEFIFIGWENGLYPNLKTKNEILFYESVNEFVYLYYYKDEPVKENLTGDYGMHYFYDFGIIDNKDILRTTKVRYEDSDLYIILKPRLQKVEKEYTKRDKSGVENTYEFPESYIQNIDF